MMAKYILGLLVLSLFNIDEVFSLGRKYIIFYTLYAYVFFCGCVKCVSHVKPSIKCINDAYFEEPFIKSIFNKLPLTNFHIFFFG